MCLYIWPRIAMPDTVGGGNSQVTELTFPEMLEGTNFFLWIDTEDSIPAWAITDGDLFEGSVTSIVLQFGSLGETVKEPASLIRKLCSPLVEAYNDNDGDYAVDFTPPYHPSVRQMGF